LTRDDFYYAIKMCGNQSLPERQRWKDIIHLYIGKAGVINFRSKIRKDKILFVDGFIDQVTETRLTGFYILETPHPDSNDFSGSQQLTFVPLDIITSVTFRNVNNVEFLSEYFKLKSQNIIVSLKGEFVVISTNDLIVVDNE
jgi:hypothetical protein